MIFLACSTVDRREGIRRKFLAGHSRARFGIASDVMDVLQVSWIDPSDPVRGFNDMAISQSDAEGMKDSIATGRVLENGMVVISSIDGTGHGFGVENFMRSVLTAGEPSDAFDEAFTLTYVAARSVGIGAKLGSPWAAGYPEGKRREHNSHKFLSAKQRYFARRLLFLSNDQLDGAKNMDANGVTFALHAVYDDGQF
jgi:acetyl-CoA carboxylase / biotin carboxylase 1